MNRSLTLAAVAAIATFAIVGCSVDDGTSSATDNLEGGSDGGSCKAAPRSPVACAANYDPVCGCDGITYKNDCVASLYVTSFTPGDCPGADGGSCKQTKQSPVACTAEHNPVCGCDGITYSNDCVASLSVTSFTPGACPEADAGACTVMKVAGPAACPAVEDPVCGCDGSTYGNACKAGQRVSSWTPGACR